MISLYDLLEAANGQLFGEPSAQLFSGFCLDSRFAAEASLYVALNTEWRDGHRYIAEAVQNGATGVLCTRPPEFDTTGLSVVLVRDVRAALMNWSRYVLKKLNPHVIGVAGTSGTSVAVEAISHVLAARYPVHRTLPVSQGWLNLPLTLASLKPEHKMLVLEFAAALPGEMSDLVLTTQPQVGVVTRLGYADRPQSADQLAGENGLLVEYLPASGLAVLSDDDERARSLASRTHARVITTGLEGFSADITAYNIVHSATGTGFDLRVGSGRFVGRWTPLLGARQLRALLAAVAVGTHFDIPPAEALRALTSLVPLPGHMNPLPGINDSLVVDDSHDAEPGSALSALDWLQAACERDRRAIFVFGGMDNLGEASQRAHRAVGQRAAESADLLVTIGAEAAYAARAALDHGMEPLRVRITDSLPDAVAQLTDYTASAPGSLVLVNGGASARTELVTRALLSHDADAARLPRAHLITEADLLLRPHRSSWVETDLDAIAHNVRGLKALVGDQVTLFAVVKANAYGHGAVAVARTALGSGAEHLAVASITEALELRAAGIEAPILVMSYTAPDMIRIAISENITLTVYDLELARAYERTAREMGAALRVHVKVDTGMGRIGVLASETPAFFRALRSLTNLEIEGIYTHFSAADDDPDYTRQQIDIFRDLLTALAAAGFSFRYVHAANSAGTLLTPEAHFNAVRTGLAIYGLSPSETVRVPPGFRPALAWKTVVAQVKTLPPGHPVGYGNTYITESETRVAIIPVGYSDGLRRAPHNWGQVLVRGQFAPIIGRISMEKTTLDVTHIPGVAVGDQVVLLGTQGAQSITADDVAQRLGTISYEVICAIAPRAPRR